MLATLLCFPYLQFHIYSCIYTTLIVFSTKEDFNWSIYKSIKMYLTFVLKLG